MIGMRGQGSGKLTVIALRDPDAQNKDRCDLRPLH